jgi:transcription-repair coupling factor (superfamily II helicase)
MECFSSQVEKCFLDDAKKEMILSHGFYSCLLCLLYVITLDSLQLNSRFGLKPVKIAANRYILPGDYIVHETYGVGQYMGIKDIVINPGYAKLVKTQGVVVQFADTEMTWYERLAPQELYLFTSYEEGKQSLNTALDTKKWEKLKETCQKESLE